MRSYRTIIVVEVMGLGLLFYAMLSGRGFLTPSILLFILGVTLNFVVCLANGKRFPIELSDEDEKYIEGDPNYVRASNSTRFRWLGDRFRVFGAYRFSIGDVLLGMSILVYILILLFN